MNTFPSHEIQRIYVTCNFSKFSTKYSTQNGKIPKGGVFAYKADHEVFLKNLLSITTSVKAYSILWFQMSGSQEAIANTINNIILNQNYRSSKTHFILNQT